MHTAPSLPFVAYPAVSALVIDSVFSPLDFCRPPGWFSRVVFRGPRWGTLCRPHSLMCAWNSTLACVFCDGLGLFDAETDCTVHPGIYQVSFASCCWVFDIPVSLKFWVPTRAATRLAMHMCRIMYACFTDAHFPNSAACGLHLLSRISVLASPFAGDSGHDQIRRAFAFIVIFQSPNLCAGFMFIAGLLVAAHRCFLLQSLSNARTTEIRALVCCVLWQGAGWVLVGNLWPMKHGVWLRFNQRLGCDLDSRLPRSFRAMAVVFWIRCIHMCVDADRAVCGLGALRCCGSYFFVCSFLDCHCISHCGCTVCDVKAGP